LTSAIIALLAAAGQAETPAGIATGGGGSLPPGRAVVVVGGLVVVVVVVVGAAVVVVVVAGLVVVVCGGGAACVVVVVATVGGGVVGGVVVGGVVVAVVVVVVAIALRLKPDPGSSDCVDLDVTHMRALKVWPTLMVLSATPDPPVTFPIITTRLVPKGHLLAFTPALYMTFAIVVPLRPDHVVRLTSVSRFVTETPEPPVAVIGVHPAIVAFLVSTPPTTTGVADASFVHSADGIADADTANGTASNEHPAIEITRRPYGVRRRMYFPFSPIADHPQWGCTSLSPVRAVRFVHASCYPGRCRTTTPRSRERPLQHRSRTGLS
jgi:hypothetical protein